MRPIAFMVPGIPQTAGSKRAFPFRGEDGKLHVAVSDMNPKGKAWKSCVVDACRAAYDGPVLTEALSVNVTFWLPRPKGHFGSGAKSEVLKPTAPLHHKQRPDITKLLRCFEDALNGVLWRDDSQIVEVVKTKRWCKPGINPGIDVVVMVLWEPPKKNVEAPLDTTTPGN